ncbi:hypothetical protein LUPAC06_02982 [Micromonospora saelicesensis]|nr:hypothetical protein LUPAC06_02982 [Micromonospora saelicesensis]
MTWFSIALRSAVPSMLCIQPGCCEYQARVWPRTFQPREMAWFTIRSALLKVKLFCCGSVASIFISFSGVMALNSRFRIVV